MYTAPSTTRSSSWQRSPADVGIQITKGNKMETVFQSSQWLLYNKMNGDFREKEQNQTVCTHSCRYNNKGTACASSTSCQLQKCAGLNCPSGLGNPWPILSRSAGIANLCECWPVSTPVPAQESSKSAVFEPLCICSPLASPRAKSLVMRQGLSLIPNDEWISTKVGSLTR